MAETEKEAEKKVLSPEQIAHRRAAKLLAFHSFRQTWREANPSADPEQRKAAWAEARGGELRKARKTLRRLYKGGYKLVPTEA